MSLLNTIGGAPGAWATAVVKTKAFVRADTNADANLDKAELQAAFDAVAVKTGKPAGDAEAVIARIDQNGDGELTRREIRAHLRDLRDLRAAPASTVELARRDGTGS